MNFEEIVRGLPSIGKCYRDGLSGVKGEHRSKLQTENPRHWKGSADLEKCYFQSRGEASFDYLIGHGREGYFVEIHPASTSEVNTLVLKKESIERWLKEEASSLKKILAYQPYVWLSTNKVAILKNSPQAKRLAKSGIRFPQSVIRL